MPAENLRALAALAGNAVVAAASIETWDDIKHRLARLLGRGDPHGIRVAELRLDETREQLTTAEGVDLERVHAFWRTAGLRG